MGSGTYVNSADLRGPSSLKSRKPLSGTAAQGHHFYASRLHRTQDYLLCILLVLKTSRTTIKLFSEELKTFLGVETFLKQWKNLQGAQSVGPPEQV